VTEKARNHGAFFYFRTSSRKVAEGRQRSPKAAVGRGFGVRIGVRRAPNRARHPCPQMSLAEITLKKTPDQTRGAAPPAPAAPPSAADVANRSLRAASRVAPPLAIQFHSALARQMKRPRSNRFAIKHSPVPSHHSNFTRSPCRPRKTKACPQNGLLASAFCTRALRPVNPFRVSVTPAASQTRVPLATTLIGATP